MRDVFRAGAASKSGSLEYRKNRNAIWQANVPNKYTRLLDLIPGQRVLELGAAEGVLSLLLAKEQAESNCFGNEKGSARRGHPPSKFLAEEGNGC